MNAPLSHPVKPWARLTAEEKRQAVLPLIKADLTLRQIAEKLGTSRNSIAGVTTRLREIGALPPPSKRGGNMMPRAAKKFQAKASEDNGAENAPKEGGHGATGDVSRLAGGRTPAATSERMDVTSPGGENPASLLEPHPKMVSLVELELGMCKFPIGDPRKEDFGFCGHETDGQRAFCAYHHRVSYYKPSKEKAHGPSA